MHGEKQITHAEQELIITPASEFERLLSRCEVSLHELLELRRLVQQLLDALVEEVLGEIDGLRYCVIL